MPDSIWKQLPAHPSCVYAGHPFKSEGFGQCAGDPTSITLNMGVVAEKQGCYAYTTEDKKEWTMDEPGAASKSNPASSPCRRGSGRWTETEPEPETETGERPCTGRCPTGPQ